MPGPQMRVAIPLCRAFRSPIPCGAHRLGRLLRVALYRCRTQRAVRRFRGAWTGRRDISRTLAALRGRRNTILRVAACPLKTLSDFMCTTPSGPFARPTIFPGCRTTDCPTPRNTFCRRFLAAEPPYTRRASGVHFAAHSAASSPSTTDGSEPKKAQRTASVLAASEGSVTPLTPCSFTTTIFS